MNVSLDNPDHVINMISGFEAIKLKDYQNPNAQYANTVLKMNGCDLSTIAGQEGFLSAIKTGGKKLIEMIWNFLKKVKDFFFSPSGTKADKTVDDAVKASEQAVKEVEQTSDLPAKVLENEGVLKQPIEKICKLSAKDGVKLDFHKLETELRDSADFIRDAIRTLKNNTGKGIAVLDKIITLSSYDNSWFEWLYHFDIKAKIDGDMIDDKVVLTSTKMANELSMIIRGIRSDAKKYLSKATPILDELNKVYEKGMRENADPEAKETATKLEHIIQYVARSMSQTVKLIQKCNEYIKELTKAIAMIASKLYDKNAPAEQVIKDIEDLDRFMTE